jgi:hypothetical protein
MIALFATLILVSVLRPVSGAVFDFSLSNSGMVSVAQSGSGWNRINVTLTGGAGQTVGLSASGLPSGAFASFILTSVESVTELTGWSIVLFTDFFLRVGESQCG